MFNVIFVLAICGLWHGANWPMVLSFTMVGVFMAIRYVWQNVVVRAIKPSNSYRLFDNYFPDFMHSIITIFLFLFCFLLFRVHTAQVAINHLHPTEQVEWITIAKTLYSNLFRLNTANYFQEWMLNKGAIQFGVVLFFMFILFFTEAIIGDAKIESVVLTKNKMTRWIIYSLLLMSIVWFGIFNNTSFVYFQY